MLNKINQYYLVFSTIIYIILINKIEQNYLVIYCTNFLSVLMFCLLINNLLSKSEKYYNTINLGITVFALSFFWVFTYNFLSYIYKGNFWVFAEIDPLFYHSEAIRFNSKPLAESINYFLQYEEYEDMGGALVISFLYRIVESNLIVNLFYILTGVISSLAIYRISKQFIPNKYSFLCAITYSLSSYVLWFHSTGLKESFMLMVIVLFFDQYYKLKNGTKKLKSFFLGIGLLSILLLFRPMLIFFCAVSLGMAFLVSKKIGLITWLIIISGLVAILAYFSFMFIQANTLLAGGDPDKFIEVKETIGVVKGSIPFSYLVNLLSSFLGPFPTFDPSKNDFPSLSLCSGGLLFRVLLSVSFLMGLFYIFKLKIKEGYPIVFFALIEMFSLILIFESVNLRKNLPHFPMIYIITFWFLANWKNESFFSVKKQKRLVRIYRLALPLLIVLVLYWNFR